MKRFDKDLRKRLIDGIASGKKNEISDALDEAKGKVFRVRNFLDMMIAQAIREDRSCKIKLVWDPDVATKELYERIRKNRKSPDDSIY